jgi:hypothetical protein
MIRAMQHPSLWYARTNLHGVWINSPHPVRRIFQWRDIPVRKRSQSLLRQHAPHLGVRRDFQCEVQNYGIRGARSWGFPGACRHLSITSDVPTRQLAVCGCPLVCARSLRRSGFERDPRKLQRVVVRRLALETIDDPFYPSWA